MLQPEDLMEQRIRKGREHLAQGDEALRGDSVEYARQYFAAALLQFRGPELLLGEAHARRGLAEVARRQGRLRDAAREVDLAIVGYRRTCEVLKQLDPNGLASPLSEESGAGECTALVLLSGLQLQLGEDVEARKTMAIARDRVQSLGSVRSAAGVWGTLGRAAMRHGNYVEARACLQRAEKIHLGVGDTREALGCALQTAEVERLAGSSDVSRAMLEGVATEAHNEGLVVLEGRAVSALAAIVSQDGDYERAASLFEDALSSLGTAEDGVLMASALIGLGDARSRLAGGAPVDDTALQAAAQLMVDGLRQFQAVGQLQGAGAGYMRLGQHAHRSGRHGLALALAECARRAFVTTDPVRGVGQALRLAVKAANGLSQGPVVLALAWMRADLLGHINPKAKEVLSFYRSRAPREWVERLESISATERIELARVLTERSLQEVLEEAGATMASLDDVTLTEPLLHALLVVEST
jgi:tetratricopeptide (TPR) repeat protein